MTDKLPSSRFRKQLKDQLPLLTAEGLITQDQVFQLNRRYRLDELGSEAMSHLLSIIYGVGSLLIGVGIISFVAAHWDVIPRLVKIVLLFSAMLAAHGAGLRLWKVRGSHPKLGHTLVLLGTLIFGANIGLMAQIFHIRGNPYDAFLAWSIGAAVMAYAAGSVPNGTVALVTAAIYFFGMAFDSRHGAPLWFPMAVLVGFVPLVILFRSRWLLWLVLILLTASLPMGGAGIMDEFYAFPVLFCLAGFVFIGGAMASRLREAAAFLATPARIAAVTAAAIGLYLASFHDLAGEMAAISPDGLAAFPLSGGILCGFFIAAGLVMAAAGIAGRSRSGDVPFLACIAASLLILAVLPFTASFFTLTVLANLAYAALCGIVFYNSFRCESRGAFWSAAAMLFLLIISRTLEYETELLLKAAIFVTCGIGFIVAGIWFERFLKARRELHA